MTPKPTLIIRSQRDMEYHSTLHAAADSLQTTSHMLSAARRQNKPLKGARVVEVDDRIDRLIRVSEHLGRNDPIEEGRLSSTVCRTVMDGLPDHVWSRTAIQTEEHNQRNNVTYLETSEAEEEDKDEERQGLQQRAKRAGRRALSTIDEEAEKLSQIQQHFVYLLVPSVLALVLWPRLRSLVGHPVGLVNMLFMTVVGGGLLDRYGAQLNRAVTRALRSFVHPAFLREVSFLTQLALVQSLFLSSVAGSTVLTNWVWVWALYGMDKGWDLMKHRIVSSFGRLNRKLPYLTMRFRAPLREDEVEKYMKGWLNSLTGEQISNLARRRDTDTNDMHRAVASLWDYAIDHRTLKAAAHVCHFDSHHIPSLRRCFTELLMERP